MAKIRVLQVALGLAVGGVENWLLDVLRAIDRDRFQVDVLAAGVNGEVFGEEVLALGTRVIGSPAFRRPWRYARSFRRALQEYGPFDIVHSHVHYINGFVLRLARRAGVAARVSHIHADSRVIDEKVNLVRRCYYGLMRYWIHKHATLGLACSRVAAEGMYGTAWEADPRFRLLYYGINLAPFHKPVNPGALRASLGLPEGAFVMGHVGRFAHQKNHPFLVRVAAEVVERDPNAYLLLVGEGPDRPEVERQVAQGGLAKHVIFAGPRDDVPQLLRGAMDVLLLPSFYEGLPLVGLEAQAAGLPMVFADNVSPETDFIPGLVRRRSLGDPPSAWAEAVLAARDAPPKVSRAEALGLMEGGPFTIRESVRRLEQFYVEAHRGK